jgi:hypothetical protein
MERKRTQQAGNCISLTGFMSGPIQYVACPKHICCETHQHAGGFVRIQFHASDIRKRRFLQIPFTGVKYPVERLFSQFVASDCRSKRLQNLGTACGPAEDLRNRVTPPLQSDLARNRGADHFGDFSDLMVEGVEREKIGPHCFGDKQRRQIAVIVVFPDQCFTKTGTRYKAAAG